MGSVLTRERLYEEVWTTPLTTLAKRYGISDVALGKICRRLNVPKPGLGYWAKVDAGQKPARTPLPARSLQQAYEIRPRPVEQPETEEQVRARQAHQELVGKFANVQVPEVVERRHSLTRRTEQHFKNVRKQIREAARNQRYGVPQVVFAPYSDKGRYRCSGEEGFPVVVSLENLDRALRILDTWAKEVERVGFVLGVDREKKLEARKEGEVFAFYLREGYTKREFSVEEQKARKEASKYPEVWEWVGSDKFTFSLEGSEHGTRREWSDGKQPLEARMAEMLATVVEFVPLAKKSRAERQEEERKGAEQERQRWAEESRRQREKDQLEKLVKAEHEVSRSQAALSFLERLEAELRRSGEGLSTPIAEWLAAARLIAKRANPVSGWVEELQRLGTSRGVESGPDDLA